MDPPNSVRTRDRDMSVSMVLLILAPNGGRRGMRSVDFIMQLEPLFGIEYTR